MNLKEIIKASNNIVFFGGAGVSTESGIPDFRSESGIYASIDELGVPPETILSYSFFIDEPKIFYKFYRDKIIHTGAKPNDAHKALKRLEELGKLKAVITQNIDGLHQMAGSMNVLELHGSIHRNYCQSCGLSYGLDHMVKSKGLPICERCGGLVRPDVVLYDEELSNEVVARSLDAISNAEVLIIGGTSLSVYPAASYIEFFKGKTLILINKSPTIYDKSVDMLIQDSIGKVLKEAVEGLDED